jgi:ABC-2 type transport system ATP-binding protein
MNPYVIEADGLTRYFGRKCAVDAVNLRIPRGSVTALLGRNGSGKSTLIRMLLGLLEPDCGRSMVLGYESLSMPAEAAARIGYVAEGHPLYGWMTIRDLAAHQSRFYRSWNQSIYRRVVDHFDLDESTRCGHLSRGQRAGVALAVALAPEPELLILDDPSLGLDPVARRALLQVILDVCGRGDRTILLATHELQDVERIADRVLILDKSVLVADAEKDYFLSEVSEFAVTSAADPKLDIKGLIASRREGEMLHLMVAKPDASTYQLLSRLGKVEQHEVTLEDAVIAYLGRRGRVLDSKSGGAA